MSRTLVGTLCRLTPVPVSVMVLLVGCGGGGDSPVGSATAPAPSATTPAASAVSASPSQSAASAAAASVTPIPLTFPSTALGVSSSPQTVTLANTGGSSFQLKSYRDDPQFRIAGGTCLTSPVVAAGDSCSFTVTYTPTARGAATGALTVTTDLLAPVTVATAGSSPTTVSLPLGGKPFTLAYPTPISGYPDTDPATLPSDVTASLWNLVAGVSTISNGAGAAVPVPNAQPLSSVQWPIRFGYWTLSENLATTRGTGCQLDLVGSSLVLTANGVSTSVPVDGTPAVLNSLGQAIYPGDTIKTWASLRTIGTVSIVRSVEIDAFDGVLLGDATAVHLAAFYDTHGTGAYGTASATRQTATTLQQYVCTDTP